MSPVMGSSDRVWLAGLRPLSMATPSFTQAGSGIGNHATAQLTKSHHHEDTEEGKNLIVSLI